MDLLSMSCSSVTTWECPNGCLRQYNSKRSLVRHLRYECGVPKMFKCDICDLTFARKQQQDDKGGSGGGEGGDGDDLESDDSSMNRMWHCPNDLCDRKYRNKTSLRRHITYECGVTRKFSCPIYLYPESFLQDDSSIWHCPNSCKRSYKSKKNLQRHLKYECGVTKKFKCRVCNFHSARRSNWNHTNFLDNRIPLERNDDSTEYFNCPKNCGRRYKRKGHLNSHIKYECGVPRQFHCNLCDKSFTRRFELKKHLLMRHGLFP
ncbi:hypothetical protein V9T40_010898 [Parthenolecanium corni]|uniref:C2H2-type domain-containing protein n=1 Tax=Parthenolecanium corni TaxID=536013 RepID=A0AAN9T4F3_9HEMI